MKVAATTSLTNVLNFKATHEGTMSMTERTIRSRQTLYSRMNCADFNADEANSDFFAEE
ncbi:MAG: hypothetical protein IKU98_08165 [Bacteroidaceae bacterium]|nr:hypothetical protein [Bacteroidaceae bacterium]